MNPAIQNPSDRPAPAAVSEQAGAERGRQDRARPTPNSPHDVMDTLLGENNLAAFDAFGGDPYNATGKFVRR